MFRSQFVTDAFGAGPVHCRRLAAWAAACSAKVQSCGGLERNFRKDLERAALMCLPGPGCSIQLTFHGHSCLAAPSNSGQCRGDGMTSSDVRL